MPLHSPAPRRSVTEPATASLSADRNVVADGLWAGSNLSTVQRICGLVWALGACMSVPFLAAAPPTAHRWRGRPDPFALFSHYPTAVVATNWRASARDPGGVALAGLLDLTIARYGLDPQLLPHAAIEAVHGALAKGERSVADLLAALPGDRAANTAALMWLVKFGLAGVHP